LTFSRTVRGASSAHREASTRGVAGRHDRLDTLVNNAGAVIANPFTDYTAADCATVAGVSLTGSFWLTQRAIAEMAVRYGGHVVTVSATLAGIAGSGTPSRLDRLRKDI